MREMKDSGIAWIGKIPKEWGIVKFKYLHNGLNTGEAIDKEYWESDAGLNAFYTAGLTPIRTGYSNFPTWKETGENDLLLARNGTPYVYLPVSKAYYTDHIIRAAMSSLVNRRFIRYCLQQSIASIAVDSVSIPTWSATLWNNQILTWPSVIEQERIAGFLDAECAEIDTVLEKTRASIEEYKKLKQAVITQAVTKGVRGDRPMKNSGIEWIGEIPAEWKVASIGRFCFVTKLAGFEFTNDMMSNIQDRGDIPIVRAQNIKMGKFINNISEFIPYRISQKLERCALNRKCLIITFIGAGIGEVAIFNEPKRYHLAPNIAKIVINVGMEHFVTEEYLLYFLMSFAGQEEINKIKKATAQPSLSMGTIRSIKMVLPDSIEEQSEIVSYLDMRCASIDALIAKKQQYLIEIENYKKSLIYEYVTGKKEVV